MRRYWVFLILHLLLAEISGLPELLFANRRDIRVVELKKQTKNVIIKDIDDASSIDFYFEKKIICWADVDNEFIKCVSLKEGTNKKSPNEIKKIKRGIVSPDGIAIDWLTEKIYWADSETDTIEVAEIFSENRKILFWSNLDQPRALALAPSEGLMFWSDWGDKPKIERAGMNGDETTRKVIVETDIEWPNGLTIDYDSRVLFWADGKHSSISSVDFDGHNRIKVFGELPYPFSVTYFDHTLYWTDWSTKTIHYCPLNSKNTCSAHQKVNMKLSPMYVHVYNQQRQKKVATPCDINNGQCSHLCLLAPSSKRYSCSCPTGIQLKDDYTCKEGADKMLLLARRSDVRRISLDTVDRSAVVVPLSNVQYAIAVDYDPVDKYVYWTDDKACTIQRAFVNGSNQEVLVHWEGLHADGIAIDWLARNMYWSNVGNKLIQVAKLDGSYDKVLLRGNLENPRAIAVHPEAGLMFWTDWGASPKIERAHLDGSNRVTIVDSRLGWPNGVAIDYKDNKLYWVDANTQAIEVAEFDGSKRQVILEDNLPHVFGFSFLDDYLYWTDWQKRSIERIHKSHDKQREILVDQLPNVMGLKAVSVESKLGNSQCAASNGGCSHLCFTKPHHQYVCGCAQGFELTDDNKTCVVPGGFLIYSYLDSIHRVSLKTHVDSDMLIPEVKHASAMDFDSESETLFWIESASKSIIRSPLNGSLSSTIVKFGLEFPVDLTVDWIHANIYWTDKLANRIEVAKLDGSSRRVILWDIPSPTSIAVSPMSNQLFWVESEEKLDNIFVSDLDGDNSHLFHEVGSTISSLIVDGDVLYWTNQKVKTIETMQLDGTGYKVLIKTQAPPKRLAAFDGSVYWSNTKTNWIEVANSTANPSSSQVIQVSSVDVSGLVIFQRQSQIENSACNRQKSPCFNLCFPSQEYPKYKCKCPSHFALSESGICESPKSYLLIAKKDVITRFIGNTTDIPTLDLPISSLGHLSQLDVDLNNDMIYWIEDDVIRRSFINGSLPEVFYHKENFKPNSLAVNSGASVVLISGEDSNSIIAVRTDGFVIGDILPNAKEKDKPAALSLHSLYGLVFFINKLVVPTIERISLNGPFRQVLPIKGLIHPNNMVVDEKLNTLYIMDDVNIYVFDLLGQNRKHLISGEFVGAHSMTLHNNVLYWVWKNQLFSVDIKKPSRPSLVLPETSKISDVVAVSAYHYYISRSHPCQSFSSKCSHMCVVRKTISAYPNPGLGNTPGSASCGCPVGMVLASDNQNCVPKPQCPPNHFTCNSGTRNCVHMQGRCNNVPDCSDGSDELGCSSSVCGKSFFRCANGQCIDPVWKCDRRPHCLDGSDEMVCCPAGQVLCPSTGLCIMCEAAKNCPDVPPDACPYYQVHNKPDGHSTSSYVVGMLICLIVLVIIGGIVLLYRRKPNIDDHQMESHPEAFKNGHARYRVVLSGGKVYTGVNGDAQGIILPNGHSGIPSSKSMISGTSSTHQLLSDVVNVPVRSGFVDRHTATGASSSSSSLTHYPRETMNPPPTPIAEPRPSHCCYSTHSSSVVRSSVMNSYRKYKTHNRPPPPTPCSTDVCDDSDFCSSIIGSPECRSPISMCYSSPHPTDYEDEPYPPPPTPQTHCDGTSCPPSPSTDRSYFMRGPCPSPFSPSISD